MNIIYLIEDVQSNLPKDMPPRFRIDTSFIHRDIEFIATPIVQAETGKRIYWSCGLGTKNCADLDGNSVLYALVVKRALICVLLRLLDIAAVTTVETKTETLGDASITTNEDNLLKALQAALDAAREEYDSILKALKQPMGFRYDDKLSMGQLDSSVVYLG